MLKYQQSNATITFIFFSFCTTKLFNLFANFLNFIETPCCCRWDAHVTNTTHDASSRFRLCRQQLLLQLPRCGDFKNVWAAVGREWRRKSCAGVYGFASGHRKPFAVDTQSRKPLAHYVSIFLVFDGACTCVDEKTPKIT